jgi:protein SDA1
MIELYKRKIWNDDKTVNVIAEAALSDSPKLIVGACRFFLALDYDYESDTPDSSDDENVDQKVALLKQRKGSKMTK